MFICHLFFFFRDPLYASNAFILYIQAESWISEQSGFAHVGKTQQRRRCFFHVQVLHAAALNIGESENATVPLGCDGWRVVVSCVMLLPNIPNLEMISWHFWCLTIESNCVSYLELWENLTIDCFFWFIMEDVFYRKTHLGPVNIYLL